LAALFTGELIVMYTSERHYTQFPQLSIWTSACVLDGPDQCLMVGPATLQISIRETTKMTITFHQILVWDHCRQNSSFVRDVIGTRRWDHRTIPVPSHCGAPTNRMVHWAEGGLLSRVCRQNLRSKTTTVLDHRSIEWNL